MHGLDIDQGCINRALNYLQSRKNNHRSFQNEPEPQPAISLPTFWLRDILILPLPSYWGGVMMQKLMRRAILIKLTNAGKI